MPLSSPSSVLDRPIEREDDLDDQRVDGAIGVVDAHVPRRGRGLPRRVRRHRIRRSLRRHWKGVIATLLIVMAPPVYSYVGYLRAPGTSSVAERSVEWIRDHGGDGVVNRIEQWYYTRTPPGDGIPSASVLPAIPAPVPARGATVSGSVANPAPRDLLPLSPDPIQGEGVWSPGEQSVDGVPVLYTTFLRPDPRNTSVVAGVVQFDQNLVRTVAVPGTKEPGESGWAWSSRIPRAERSTLVAAFNSGFRFQHIDGGYFTEGRTPQPLRDGQASVVITSDGRVDVGAWGRDVSMSPDVVSVRQNLHLIVDNGSPVAGLKDNADGLWGVRKHQLQYTWRSGVGVTKSGDLVLVAGDKMNLTALASALSNAGVVRGMQLDIHYKQVTATLFAPVAATPTSVEGTKLLPKMPKPVTRFLTTDQRDFFAVFVR